MKILKRGHWPDKEEWKKECSCGRCSTRVQLEVGDLRKTPTGWDPRDRISWDGKVFWDCPVCGRENDISVHEAIEQKVKEKARPVRIDL